MRSKLGIDSSPSHSDAGFSLIELLVVVAIIAMATFMVVPRITSYFKVSLNSAAREMATTIKESFNSAIVTGKVYRIVYDIGGQEYWVETAPSLILLETEQSRERKKRRNRFKSLLTPSKDEKDEEEESSIMMDNAVTSKKVNLPRGVTFEDILTQQSPETIKEGKAYTHIFPHGIVEQTIVHLTDESKHHISLVLQPLVGKTDLYERYVTGAEVFPK